MKFFKTRKDEIYTGFAGLGSIVAGAGGLVGFSALMPTAAAVAVDAVATFTLFAGSLIFRPRSQAEIQMLLGRSAMADEIRQISSAPAVRPAPTPAKTRKDAEKKLIAVMDRVLAVKATLGPEIAAATVPIFENLSVITHKWDALEGYAEIRYTVETLMDDYLPTTVHSYLNIPTKGDPELATKLKADMLAQLSILEKETKEIRMKLLSGDIQEFNIQGNFLKERFHQNDVDNVLTTH